MSGERAIRPYRPGDESAVAEVWHRAGLAAYSFLPDWQAFSLDQARKVFREVIVSSCEVWVGTVDEVIAAYLATKGSYIDRLYVDPARQGLGLGTLFLEHAKRRHPGGLELHTHQENHPARGFYEKRGFRAVRFGISPPPESAPDVEYHWRPAA